MLIKSLKLAFSMDSDILSFYVANLRASERKCTQVRNMHRANGLLIKCYTLVRFSLKGKYGLEKGFSKLRKLFPSNLKIITVLSSSLSKCDKSTLKLPLS